MAVNTKGKRKVKVKGRPFIWHVENKAKQIPQKGGLVEHTPERYLHIIATNKKFIVHYRLPKEGDPYTTLRVEGEQFPRQPGAKEVQVPRWKHDSKAYPTNDFVRRLIGWCMSKENK
ncbi:MAG: hypothetical protein GY805_14415 [Chloroflexi bacterium]|nr:hypothetical protein [Chloroflexota bacterium]